MWVHNLVYPIVFLSLHWLFGAVTLGRSSFLLLYKVPKNIRISKKVVTSFFEKINKYRTRNIISHGLYIFTPIFSAVYFVERLILQTIYVLNKEILQFLGLKSAVYNQERFQIKSAL